MTSWPHKIKILTAALENAKNQRQIVPQLEHFHVDSRICREYFVQNFVKIVLFITRVIHP